MMKKLKFNQTEIKLIKKGKLKVTWRLDDDKDLNVNDEIIGTDINKGQVFGLILIKEIVIKNIKDITQQEIIDSITYKSRNDAVNKLNVFYNKKVKLDENIKIVKFEFVEKIDDSVVKTTTILTEVKLYTDGGSRGNPGPSASGYVIENMEGKLFTSKGVYLGITTNNQAEYQALQMGLEEASKYQVQTVHVYMDSLLVVNQLKGLYKVKNKDLLPIYQSIKEMIKDFKEVTIEHVPREFNKLADAEVNKALDSEI